MTLTITLERHGAQLSPTDERRMQHHLEHLGRRLVNRPEPTAVLSISEQGHRHEIVASLRVQLGPLGPTLVSSQSASTADQATRLAVEAIERQLERRISSQRGESSRRRGGRPATATEDVESDVAPDDDDTLP
jgi:hypothetical protein